MIQILYWEYGSGKKRERFEQIEFYGSGINYGKGQQRLAQAFQPKNKKTQKHQQSFEALGLFQIDFGLMTLISEIFLSTEHKFGEKC